MPSERQQIRVLFRVFLARAFDPELLSPGSDTQKLAIQFAAILAAFNFVLFYVLVPRYFTSSLPHATVLINAWSDEEFLIGTTISIVGLLMVMAWDTLLPDLRDSLVLGVLPIRTRSIALAKALVIGIAIVLSVVLVNIFTSFGYAMILTPAGGTARDLIRSFAAYWITMAAAAVFTASLLLAIQGLMAQLFSYRVFLRVSSFVQLAVFFVILAAYFLKPPLATPAGLIAPPSQMWLRWLPSYWFLGLFQQLAGAADPVFAKLAAWALRGLCTAGLVAALLFALAYRRTMRRIVEQPDLSPTGRSRGVSRLLANIGGVVIRAPLDQAIFCFAARTLARSRRHRLLLALYGGIGLAIALAYTESLLRGAWKQSWYQPNAPLLVASLVIPFFAILGSRIVFALPLTLPSNWIFRVTAVQHPSRYFEANRKSLYALTAFPVWFISAILFLAIWPRRPAVQHLTVLILSGIVIVETSLCGFRKVPFACSYLPGKANLNVTLPLYASLVLFLAHQGGMLEFWALQRFPRYIALICCLAVAAIWARRRFNQFASAPLTPIQFEDLPPQEILRIDLQHDGELRGGEAYVDVRNG
jgi:hypothetical protein